VFVGQTDKSEPSVGWGIVGKDQLVRGSQAEEQKKKAEEERASKIYGNFSNSDFLSGGKKSDESKSVISLGKAQAFFGKTESGTYGWSDIGKDQLVRGSAKEEAVKQSEAERAFTNAPSKANASYVTGGTPDKTFGGISTPQSKDRSAGWSVLAPDQFSRNSAKESQVKTSEVNRVATAFPSSQKSAYDVPFGLVDQQAQKGQREAFRYVSSGKAEQENALGNGLISLSNQQVAAKNIKSEKEFQSFLNEGQKQGAVFSFFSGNKKVGESSGPRTYHDFLKAQKEYGSISVGENFPSKEKELTGAVQKNTSFYSNLPQSYWAALSKEGYLSEKNSGKINDILNLNAKIQNRENLAMSQGFLFAQNRGGEIMTDKGIKIIGPQENEAASFMKFPFAGEKRSTSFIKSTSYADVLQFYPGIPGLGKALKPASEGWLNLIDKGQQKIGNAVKIGIADRALSGEAVFKSPKPKPESVTFESSVGARTGKTFRPTNPMREKVPSDVLSRDNAQGPNPFSARQNTPRNTLFEDTSKETITKNTKIQNDLLKPRTPDTNPPASRNIPFFAGRTDPFGRLFTANKPAVKPPKTQGSTTPANISGLTSGVAPIRTTTDVSTTGLSPLSSEFFGVQFQGSYPTSYLPPAAGQIGSQGARTVESDIFYRPARKTRNIELPFGEQPRESVSATPELLGSRKSLVKENQSIFLSRIQSNLLTPSKKETIKFFESKPPEETNPLGRRGKSPIKASSPLDITQTPRSEFVERGRIKPENEVFSNKGQKLKNEYGDVLFGNLGKPQGALRKPKVTSTKSTKPEINLEPQKEYQDWRFQKNAAKGPFNYKFRIGKEPKEVNLEPRGDYQDWKFSKFIEKNPQPEKTGESSSRLNDIFRAGQSREVREKKFAKPSQANQDLINGNVGKFFANENNMFSENKINLGKGIGRLVPKSGGGEAIRKTFKKPPPPSFTRTFEEPKGNAKEVGGGLLAILKEPATIKKTPQVLRKPKVTSTQIISASNIQKPRTNLNKIMSGYLANLQKQRLRPEQATKARQSQIFKPVQEQRQQSKQFSIFKPAQKQTRSSIFKPILSPRQQPKPFSGLITSPKQGQKPHQGQSYKPIFPTPQRPTQKPTQAQTQPNRTPTLQITKNPKPPKALLPFIGSIGRNRKGKSRSGPTALYNLNVNNIFASSFNINVGKNRVEF